MGDTLDEGSLTERLLDVVLASGDDPVSSLQGIVRLMCDTSVADHAQLFVVEPDDVHLRLAAAAASDPAATESLRDALAGTAVRLDSSLSGRATRSAEPILLNRVRDSGVPFPSRFLEHVERFDVSHVVALRVPGHGRDLGALMASRTGDHPPFEPADVALLTRIAAISAFALERLALRRRVERQADILDRVADAVLAVDENRVVTKWNRGAERLYRISRDEAVGRPLAELFTTVSHEPAQLDTAWGELSERDAWRDAVRQVTRDGRVVEVEASVTPLHDDETGFAGAVAINRDVSTAMRAQRELAERQAFAEALLDVVGGRTLVIATDGQVRAVNARYEKEGPFGEGPGSGPDVGADALAFLDLLAHGIPGVGTIAEAVRAALAGRDAVATIDVPAGGGRWTAAQVQRFVGPGGGALVTFVDVSERKAHELELAHLATHDSLTGLPNRALMLDRLRESLARAHRRARPLAVLFVDLDGLKQVNDAEGHDAGDDMLRAAAERLARCCRAADTVARLGGDEFVVLLDEITDAAEAEALAVRMLTTLREPGVPASRSRYVGSLSASIGVALADGKPAPTERDALDLVGHADAAMLVAKRSGKDQVVLIARPRSAGAAIADQPDEV
jgi:diguanylate cyclase (GGDEF)-like protein/PAS domain S-box-containing protein